MSIIITRKTVQAICFQRPSQLELGILIGQRFSVEINNLCCDNHLVLHFLSLKKYLVNGNNATDNLSTLGLFDRFYSKP